MVSVTNMILLSSRYVVALLFRVLLPGFVRLTGACFNVAGTSVGSIDAMMGLSVGR